MAKRKKHVSTGKKSSGGKEIKILVGVLVYAFLFVAIFSNSGLLIATVHQWLSLILGTLTPVFALYMLWYAGHTFLPKLIPAKFNVIAGSILFFVSLAGLVHGFVQGDGAVAAAQGLGGGWVGQFLFSGLTMVLGSIISRLVLIILMIISLIVAFDFQFMRFFASENSETEEESDSYGSVPDSKVKVMGEIQGTSETSALKKLGQRFGKTSAPVVEMANTKTAKATMASPRRSDWNYPSISLLHPVEEKPQAGNIKSRMEIIQKTLRDFNIDVTMTDVRIGPTVSQYTLKPAEGVKLTQITARQDDLALALAAESLRVEAPIPGKSLVGVEIPNDKKAMVGLRDILKGTAFTSMPSKLAIALGRDAAGDPSVADLAKMPHLLIAGATGSGKSVCINTLILSLLMNNSPDELRMILVDPKRVELTLYNNIPHLLAPVITEPKDTVKALNWCVKEMERRYKLLSSSGKRNIEQYNQNPELVEGKLPFIVVIVDELADLMMVSAREVESKIVRLAQMARAVGIHLIVATQRPSVDVITGLIKANIPTRIAFAVTSQIDSRTIIDSAGAEKLLGHGDMLYMSTDLGKPRRIQGVYCSEEEINSVIAHIRQQDSTDRYDPSVLEDQVESRFVAAGGLDDEEEALLRDAYELVRKHKRASTSMLQTYMKLGYNKAKRIVTAMEERGMIGPERGGKQREVYNVDIDGSGSVEDELSPNDMADGGIVPYPENE